MYIFPTQIPDCDSHSPCYFGFIYFFRHYYLFYNGFLSIGKFWSCGCLSFHWLFDKLKAGCPISSYSLWLLLCWLGWSSWSFERCSTGVSLISVFLLLLVNLVSGFRLELMYISRIVSIRSNLTHLRYFQQLVLLPYFIESTFFVCTNTSSESKVKFRQASDRCKRVLEAAWLACSAKTKESITSQKPGSQKFSRIANSFLNKGKSAIPPLFNGPEVLSSASDKAKLFAENFSKNSNLGDSGISLPVFPSRTNLKLHNISVIHKMIKKVITNLNLSKTSGPECIPVVVLRNCEPSLSYISAKLFNMSKGDLFSRLLEGLITGPCI